MICTVLYIGEIVGKPGLFTVKNLLKKIKTEYSVDFVIACGDSATNGSGLGKNHSIYLRKLGVDTITMGECVYFKKDMVEHIQKAPYILRPSNLPQGDPGRGWRIFDVNGVKIAVAVFLGQSGFTRVHAANPFGFLPELALRLKSDAQIVIVDFHSGTTAEKKTMFAHADGLVSAVIGSHAKALTADESVSEKGTASICDAGRTGSLISVGGLEAETRIKEYLSGIPDWAKESWEGLELQGCIIRFDSDTGKAVSIERLRVPCMEAHNERDRNGDEAGGE